MWRRSRTSESAAQDKGKGPAKGEINIRWMGQSFFEIITPKGAKIALDPHNIEGYKIKFTKAGTYNYICTVHDHMKGTVIVGGG